MAYGSPSKQLPHCIPWAIGAATAGRPRQKPGWEFSPASLTPVKHSPLATQTSLWGLYLFSISVVPHNVALEGRGHGVLGLFLIGLQHGAGDQAGPLGREALLGGAAGCGDPPQPPQYCLPGPDSTHTWCSRLMPILSKVWMRHMGLRGFVVGSLYTSLGCFSVGGGGVASVCFWVARLCACIFSCMCVGASKCVCCMCGVLSSGCVCI